MISFSKLGQFGRLGNQLFQIACTISVALDHKDKYIFPFWEYESDFQLHGCFSNQIKPKYIYEEKRFRYDDIQYYQDMDLRGYFQSYLYFDHRPEIKELLTPIHAFEKDNDLCGLHVRRGDYLSLPEYHPIQTIDYYHKAMETSGCQKFLIFSDDIQWCKANFIGNQYEFSENKHPPIDLAMMIRKCSSNIIANSSFSWFGAYLNGGKTIAPKKWFGSKLTCHDTSTLLPKDWIAI